MSRRSIARGPLGPAACRFGNAVQRRQYATAMKLGRRQNQAYRNSATLHRRSGSDSRGRATCRSCWPRLSILGTEIHSRLSLRRTTLQTPVRRGRSSVFWGREDRSHIALRAQAALKCEAPSTCAAVSGPTPHCSGPGARVAMDQLQTSDLPTFSNRGRAPNTWICAPCYTTYVLPRSLAFIPRCSGPSAPASAAEPAP